MSYDQGVDTLRMDLDRWEGGEGRDGLPGSEVEVLEATLAGTTAVALLVLRRLGWCCSAQLL